MYFVATMRKYIILLILLSVLISLACSGETMPATPLETFKTYSKAIKKKDTTTMKLLLSSETLKMHEQEAKAQGITVDDIVKRETLVSENQTSIEFRNEKIDGNSATLEVKDQFGRWETLFFVFENGEWKIDKKGAADKLLREIEEENRKADEQMKMNSSPFGDRNFPSPIPDVSNSNVAPIR